MAPTTGIVKALQYSFISFCKQTVVRSISYSASTLPGIHPLLTERLVSPTIFQCRKLHTQLENAKQELAKQEIVVNTSKEDAIVTRDIIYRVNQEIEEKKYGRLFAVVHVCGKQFKVTAEDLIVLEGYWAPSVGDKLRLDKVLLAGGVNFTLIGRPILSPGLVSVEATVIEKTLSHTKTHFRKKRRKQYMRINFYRAQYTMLRINNIEITGKINEKKDVEGLDGRIF